MIPLFYVLGTNMEKAANDGIEEWLSFMDMRNKNLCFKKRSPSLKEFRVWKSGFVDCRRRILVVSLCFVYNCTTLRRYIAWRYIEMVLKTYSSSLETTR